MADETNPCLPSPPFYTVANLSNFRDAAFSLKTLSGVRIRTNVLFRSAEVSKLDLDGWKAVHDIGVAHVFDLRSKPEVDKGWAGIVGKDANATEDGVRPGWMQAMSEAGVERTWTPVFEESDYSPERLAERYTKYMDEAVTGFVQAYRDILDNAGPAFGLILRYLAHLPPPPPPSHEEQDGSGQGRALPLGVLVHCSAGKDRTGMFFGLLFDFLGVPRHATADEYHRTELGLSHIRDTVVGRLMQSPAFQKYMASQMDGAALSREELSKIIHADAAGLHGEASAVSPEMLERGRQAALRMVGARRESMLRSLDMLDDVFGGAERYLRERCGMHDGLLDALRRNLVVEA